MKPNKLWTTTNPYVLMPLLLLMWGSFAATNKLILVRMDSYNVLFFMYGLAFVAFSVILIVKATVRELFSWRAQDYVLLVACGILAFLYDFLYIQALEVLPAVEASMLNYLFPLFIVLFAIPLHKERLTLGKVLSMGLGFSGTLLLVTKGNWANLSFTNLKGDLMAIAAAVCWGLFTNLVKMNKKDMLLSNSLITATAFILSIGALFAFSTYRAPHVPDFLSVLWLSMGNIVLGFFLYFRALKYASASLVATFTFFTPFVTLIMIVILVGEKVSLIDLVAFLLIFLSVPVQGLRLKRKLAVAYTHTPE